MDSAITEKLVLVDSDTVPDAENRNNKSSDPTSAEKQWVIEKVIDHGVAEDGEEIFRVKWYGFKKPTWEPNQNIPYNVVECYFRRMACREDASSIEKGGAER